jgi:predicted transcriptional regulator
LTTELSVGREVVSTLAECLESIGHPSRLGIVQYCLQPHTFTEIILNLKLNPASFRFHVRVLIDCNLMEKVGRGVYETTKLGKLVFELVNQANQMSLSQM